MGKTFSTGLLTNGIWQDASNNIGIGGSPSGTYKFEVTGTAKVSSTLLVSGAATFSSTADATIFNSTSNAFRFSGSNALSLVTLNSQNVVKVNAAGYWGVQLVGANDQGVVINNLGLVGIGTATPNGSYRLTCSGASSGVVGGLALVDTEAYSFSIYSASSALLFRDITNGAERMRITSGGDVLVGWTGGTFNDPAYNGVQGISLRGISGGTSIISSSTSTSMYVNRFGGGAIFASVYSPSVGTAGTTVGTISVSSTATSYNTTSDYRLKEDFKDFNGLEKVCSIKVYDFKWKNSEERMNGVIAHEIQEILPYAVLGEKDGQDMQGVDYSKLTPILVKAVQELSSQNQDLKSRLDKAGL